MLDCWKVLEIGGVSYKSFNFLLYLHYVFFFRKGSIILEFQLVFKTKVTAGEALAPLKTEIDDGKLGSLKVDRDSLKQTDPKKGMIEFLLYCHNLSWRADANNSVTKAVQIAPESKKKL